MTDADWRNGRTRDELLAMLQYARSRWGDRQSRLFGAAVLRRIWDLLTDGRFRNLVETLEGWMAGTTTAEAFAAARDRLPQIPDWQPVEAQSADMRPFRGASGRGRPVGVLNFRQLPIWGQRAHTAVDALAGGRVSELCVAAAAARAAHHAELMPEPPTLANWRDELQRAEAQLRREEADARHRGLSTGARLQESRLRVAEADERVSQLASEYQAARERTGDAARTVEFAAQADLLRCVAGTPFAPVTFDVNWRTETVTQLVRGIVAERAFDRLPILADALEEAGCDHPDVLAHCRTPGPHALGCWVLSGSLAPLQLE